MIKPEADAIYACLNEEHILFYEPMQTMHINTQEKSIRGSKTIYWVETEEEAKELESAIKSAILKVQGELNHKNKRTWKPLIKIINSNQIQLSITASAHSSKVTADSVIRNLEKKKKEKEQKQLEKDEPKAYEYILQQYEDALTALKQHEGETLVEHVGGGMAYRLTYYDREAGRRLQTNLGDIVIAISQYTPTFQVAQDRKHRSDSKDGFITLHPENVHIAYFTC